MRLSALVGVEALATRPRRACRPLVSMRRVPPPGSCTACADVAAVGRPQLLDRRGSPPERPDRRRPCRVLCWSSSSMTTSGITVSASGKANSESGSEMSTDVSSTIRVVGSATARSSDPLARPADSMDGRDEGASRSVTELPQGRAPLRSSRVQARSAVDWSGGGAGWVTVDHETRFDPGTGVDGGESSRSRHPRPASARMRQSVGVTSPSDTSGTADDAAHPVDGFDPNCLFCAIVAGRKPGFVVIDEPDVVAFLDVKPLFPGHTLLVPRRHVEVLADLPGRSGRAVLRAAAAAVGGHGGRARRGRVVRGPEQPGQPERAPPAHPRRAPQPQGRPARLLLAPDHRTPTTTRPPRWPPVSAPASTLTRPASRSFFVDSCTPGDATSRRRGETGRDAVRWWSWTRGPWASGCAWWRPARRPWPRCAPRPPS